MIDFSKLPKVKKQKPYELFVSEFSGLVNTLVSETRLKPIESKEATNLMQDEDGVWTTRWGTRDYGTVGAWDGYDIDGFASFKLNETTRHLCVIANGVFYVSVDDGANWYVVTGATITAGKKCRFLQYGAYDNTSNTVKPYLYIVNGTDPITRYDGSDLSQYVEINVPGQPTLTKTSLTGTTYTYYYVVEAFTSGGATGPGTEQSVTVGKQRDAWDTSNYVTITHAAVSDAIKYAYYVGDVSGNWYYIGESNTTTFVDYGETYSPVDVYTEPSLSNTTGGPILKAICESNNRVFGVDTNNLVWWTGNGGADRGSFGLYAGGGWLAIARGGLGTVTAVVDYQNRPHAFMKYPYGNGAIYRIDESTATVGDTTVTIQTPVKILDQTGTEAIGSVVTVENDVFYLDTDGVRVLGNEPGVLATLRTSELSQRIRPDLRSIPGANRNVTEAVYYDGKVLFSVGVELSTPDRIIVYDRERLGWIPNWTIGVSQFLIYADTANERRLLGTIGDRIVEFSSSVLGDSGSGFTQRYVSPRFVIGQDDFTKWAKFRYLHIRFRNSRGNIYVTVGGTGKNKPFSNIATATITPEGTTTGYTWDLWSNVQYSTSSGTPTTFTAESLIRRLKLKSTIRDLQVTVESSNLEDKWSLVGMKFTGRPVTTSDPKDWKL